MPASAGDVSVPELSDRRTGLPPTITLRLWGIKACLPSPSRPRRKASLLLPEYAVESQKPSSTSQVALKRRQSVPYHLPSVTGTSKATMSGGFQFTEKAQAALQQAMTLARENSHVQVSPVHIVSSLPGEVAAHCP